MAENASSSAHKTAAISIVPPASACASAASSPAQSPSSNPKRLFAECALVEIIHLHDCLRSALRQTQKDVDKLVHTASFIKEHANENGAENDAGFIKTEPEKDSSQEVSNDGSESESRKEDSFNMQVASDLSNNVASRFHLIWSVFQAHSGAEDEFIWPALKMKIESKKTEDCTSSSSQSSNCSPTKKCGCESFLEQEAYEEDHAHEETMFKQINTTLRRLNGSFRYYHSNPHPAALNIIKKVISVLKEQTDNLCQHLHQHLAKEETQCLPMVKKHLSNEEISTLVGSIMGRRSAEMMSKILNLAVCSLPQDEREDMVLCLKKAMGGTFFEKWLTIGGWDSNVVVGGGNAPKPDSESTSTSGSSCGDGKRKNMDTNVVPGGPVKKKTRFEGHITDPRMRYPSRYYIKKGNEIRLLWNSADAKLKGTQPPDEVPQFAQSELKPTYHFNEDKGLMVLGCDHYARSCKLRHPETGQLFTCRLCCEDVRQTNAYSDEMLPVLDREAVTELMCMQCFSLQPAGSKCVNRDCESKGAPFARYFCSICNLYDDGEKKQIYHCPYCNVCRKGKGLGIDFHHCMRCNACISIEEYDKHKCIPQRLQASCPICKESMFESTEPLRGMKCGHVMHLSCYNQYAARSPFRRITCPFCKEVFDNMRG